MLSNQSAVQGSFHLYQTTADTLLANAVSQGMKGQKEFFKAAAELEKE